MNRQITLARHPSGLPDERDFKLVTVDKPKIEDGQLLLRTLFVSLDPGMRRRMTGERSYADPMVLGDVVAGNAVSQVEETRHPTYGKGDYVLASTGWQEYARSDGTGLTKLDQHTAPVSTALGILGMPGFTAYYGMVHIGKPKPGETVVVSAAAGAVGSLACQVARIHGARVVGIAGSETKLSYLREELGVEAAVSHRSPTLARDLAAACPSGIDVYFENVGGVVLDAVLPLLNKGARIPLCGRIAHYNETELPAGPNRVPALLGTLLTKRVTLRGFIIHDHFDHEPEFLQTVGQWLRDGRVRYREDIVDGLENAPRSFAGLFRGDNLGKALIRVAR
jgi:NADPH-dependent curcumin reductase